MHRITLDPVGHTARCGDGDTVLAAILASAASVRFGCRGGGCGTCKMRVIAGRIEHGRPSAAVLSQEERQDGWVLSCQARPLSDLTIELTAANRFRPVTGWHAVGRRHA